MVSLSKSRLIRVVPWQTNKIFTIKHPRFRWGHYSIQKRRLECLPLWGRWHAEGVTEEVKTSPAQCAHWAPSPKGGVFPVGKRDLLKTAAGKFCIVREDFFCYYGNILQKQRRYDQ